MRRTLSTIWPILVLLAALASSSLAGASAPSHGTLTSALPRSNADIPPPPLDPCFDPPANLSVRWPFDTITSNTTTDNVSSNIGVLLGNPRPTLITGQVRNALHFNGVNYVQAADHPSLNVGTGDFSVSAWIRATNPNGLVQTWYDKRTTADKGYALFLYNNRLGIQLADDSGWTNYLSPDSSPIVADGNWHHVVATVDRNDPQGLKLYLDRQLISTQNPTGHQGSLTTSANLIIGRDRHVATNPFQGDLDEITLIKRAITSDEVDSLYYSGITGCTFRLYFVVQNDDVSMPGEQGAVLATNRDVMSLNTTGNVRLFFNGTAVGLKKHLNVIDAFAFGVGADGKRDGSLLLSFTTAGTVYRDGISTNTSAANLLAVDDSDIVKFTPSTPENDKGTFSMFLLGTDVGLENDAEDINALDMLPSGQLVVSLVGVPHFPVSSYDDPIKNTDLLLFTPSTPGNYKTGEWEMYIPGATIRLSDASNDVDGVAVRDDGSIALSTISDSNALRAANEDVALVIPPAWQPRTYIDFSTLGYSGNIRDFALP